MTHTVLIVDDEEDVRVAWQKALKHAGYKTFATGTAAAALDICDEHPIDAVVLDFIMPGMDGVHLLVEIRKRIPFIRSLIVSGKLDSDLSAATLTSELKAEIESDKYLHKPLSNPDLLRALAELLADQASADWKALAVRASKARKVTKKKATGVSTSLKNRKKK
jgi:CheY-like chemotaxis protein